MKIPPHSKPPAFDIYVDYLSAIPHNKGARHGWLITIKSTKPNKHGTKPVYWKATKAKPTSRQLRKCVKAFNKFNN